MDLPCLAAMLEIATLVGTCRSDDARGPAGPGKVDPKLWIGFRP